MFVRFRRNLSYANVMATVAVFIALGGGAYAATQLAANSVGTKQIKAGAVTSKKIANGAVTAGKLKTGAVRSAKIADNAVTGAKVDEPSLGKVPHAAEADHAANAHTVDGSHASDLLSSSAFNEDGTLVALVPGDTTVATATITTHSAGRVLATGSAELSGDGGEDTAACAITIGGSQSIDYHAQADDVSTYTPFSIAVNFATTVPAGTYTASLTCRVVNGSVSKRTAAINVYGLGQ